MTRRAAAGVGRSTASRPRTGPGAALWRRLWAGAIAALLAASGGATARSEPAPPAPAAANPRLRVELQLGPKRLTLRDRRCPGEVRDPASNPGLRRRIVALAAAEWEAFRFSTLDIASRGLTGVPVVGSAAGRARLVPDALNPPLDAYARRLLRVGTAEDGEAALLRIGGYWAVVPDAAAIEVQNQLWRIWPETGWAQAWSAAFVSWVMCEAGLDETAFRRSASHSAYVAQAFAGGSAYEPRPLSDGIPLPGDLLCAGRAAAKDVANLEAAREAALRGAPMHCDIVVGRARDRLFAIGGNVENSVSLTVVPLGRGAVLPNLQRPWFGTLRLRAPPDPDATLQRAPFRCLGRQDLEACLDAL